MIDVRRLTWASVALTTLACCTIASAATLGGATAQRLGSGDAAVTACDSDGVSVSYTISGGNVTAVTVGAIADPGCGGAQLSLQLTRLGASIGGGGPQAVPTDGDTADNSVAVAVSPQPAASLVAGISISIVGP